MKKVFFLAIAILALTSCAKDRTCHCTGDSYVENTKADYVNVVNGTAKVAKEKCEGQSFENVKAKIDCKLK